MKKTNVVNKKRFDLWPQDIYESSKFNGLYWTQYNLVNSTQSTGWISILIYRIPK